MGVKFSWKDFNTLFVSLLLITTMIRMKGGAAPIDGDEGGNDDGEKRQKRETFDMIGLLRTYGYLPGNEEGLKVQLMMSNEAVTEAIRSFQRFNGLEVTGLLDPLTIEKMQSPRCGFPDIIQKEGGSSNNGFDAQNDPQSFTSLGSRWNKDTISWKPTKFSKKLNEGHQWVAFQRALQIWAEVTPLKFRYTMSRPDMEIKFATGDHGDGWQNKFDGRGGVLAHAYGPGAGIGGDAHFDDAEDWTINTGQGTDLTQVAAHEFGHALGLGHSSVPGALMAPYYFYTDDLKLAEDDIRGIQELYGSNSKTTTEQPTSTTSTTTTAPTTTTSTTATTKKTTTTTDKLPWVPHFCRSDFRLDAIFKAPDGFVYAFRANHVYKIGEYGLEFGYPKYIRDIFPKAPRRYIRAVTFVPTNGKTYMFKNTRVWRFTGFELDPGYPKTATHTSALRPSSAITVTYNGISQIYLFGYNTFWEWDIYSESIVPGFPLSSRKYFPSAPLLPDASYMNSQGNFFFFKHKKMMTLSHRGARAETFTFGPSLFGPVCGIDTENPGIVSLDPPQALKAPPQMPPIKFDEASFDSYPADSFEVIQPENRESPMVKSFILSDEEAAMRKAFADVGLAVNEDIINDYLSWSSTMENAQSRSRRNKSSFLRKISDALRDNPNW